MRVEHPEGADHPREQAELLSRLSNRLRRITPQSETGGEKKVAQKVASILRECDKAATVFTQKTEVNTALLRSMATSSATYIMVANSNKNRLAQLKPTYVFRW